MAAVYVMAFHLYLSTNRSGLGSRFILHGYLAVDLFFALSGFVMALTYAESFRLRFNLSTQFQFLGRRIARVYPLYLVATLTALFLHLSITAPVLDFRNVIWNILMVQSWGLGQSLDGPSWSISAEFAAYVLFPLLLVPTLFRRWQWAALTGIACSAGIIGLALKSPAGDGTLNYFEPRYALPVFRCLFEFTLGVIAYRLAGSAVGKVASTTNLLAVAISLSVLILLTVSTADAVIVFLFVALLISLAADSGLPARLLKTAPIHQIGLLSYSIYLTHTLVYDLKARFVLHQAKHGIHYRDSYLTIGAIPVVFFVSWITHRYIENPARLRLQRLFEPNRQARQVSPVL